MEKSLFEKYGGFSKVSRIVLSLYDRLLDDDDLGPFFDDVNMGKLVDHQTKFVSSLLGGPASFSDDHLVRAHAHMDIKDLHFDKLCELLTETLSEHGMKEQDIETVITAFDARRSILRKD